MAAKFHFCLLLIILGTIIVQGARPGNLNKNPMLAHFLRQMLPPGYDCTSIGGICIPENSDSCPDPAQYDEECGKPCQDSTMKCCCPYRE